MDPALLAKKLEFEQVKARAKALRLRLTCVICGEKAKLNCPCETTQYCSKACQKIDWRERGHREACKKIRDDRAAEAARAEAPTPPPPPEEVFYGPAPRSHADEVRARIAAEHEAARARREANPEPEPQSARVGSRCPICFEDWDVNHPSIFRPCCCRAVCRSCTLKISNDPCPLCRTNLAAWSDAEQLASIRRHVENDVPEAILELGTAYRDGAFGLVKSGKKAVKIWKRAVELGDVHALVHLGVAHNNGLGVKVDKKKAQQFYRMAADRGNAQAQCNLGMMLLKQWNDESLEEGVSILRKSAAQGLTYAENYLGGFLALSDDENYRIEGMRLLKRAAAKGHEGAKEMLRSGLREMRSMAHGMAGQDA
jgi:TPR repeat protein